MPGQAMEAAAMKFVKSVAEGNSAAAKALFTDEAVLFGYLDGKYLCIRYLLLPQQDDSGTPVSGQDAEEDRNKAGIG
jgi:hypothetical protein